MFPSDQQKRLQVVNSSNPSLRSVAAPFSLQGGNFSLQGAPNIAAPQLPSNMRLGPVQVARPGGLQVGNQVIQQNGGTTNAQPRQPTVNPFIAGLKTIGNSIINPVERSANTIGAFGVGLGGLADAGYQSAFGNDQSYNQAVRGTNSLVDSLLSHGLGNQGGYLTPAQAASSGGGFQGLKTNFIKPLVTATSQVAPLVLPFGKVGEGLGLGGRMLAQGGTNAAVGATTDALQQYLNTGKVNPGEVLKTGAITGTIGAAVPLASRGIGKVFTTPSEQNQFINYLSKERDANAIHDTLASIYGGTSDAIKQVSKDIANSPNKQFIIKRLADLPEEGAVVGVGGELAKDAIQTQTDKYVKANDAAQQRAKQQAKPKEVQMDFGTVDPRTLPPDHVNASLRNAVTKTEVPSQVDQSLVDQGLVKGTVQHVPAKSLKLGSDTAGVKADPQRVAELVNQIKSGQAIEPIIVSRDESGALTNVQDGQNRLAALKKAGVENAPVIEQTTTAERQAARATAPETITPEQQAIAQTAAKAPVTTTGEGTASSLAQDIAKQTSAGLSKAEIKDLEKQGFEQSVINQMHEQAGGKLEAGKPVASDAPKAKAQASSIEKPKPEPVDMVPQVSSEGKISRLTSLENRLTNIGESGKAARQTIRNKEVAERVHTQELKDSAQPFFDLTPEEQSVAIKVQKGEATTQDARIQQGADSLKAMFKQAHAKATTAGKSVGNLGDNYFPRTYPKGWFDKPENFNKAAQDLVKSGKASSLEDAVAKLNKLKVEGKLDPTEFGNFRTREKDLPGGIEDANTVANYIKGASKSISEAEHFGTKGEVLAGHVADAIKNGEDAGALKDILSHYTRPPQAGKGLVSKGLNAYQKTLRVLQLPRAAVSHLPQGFANTASDIGYKQYFQAMAKKVFKDPETEAFLHQGGFRIDDFGKSSRLADKATAPGLAPMLQFHREVAAEGGRSVALGLAKRGDAEALGKIGVDGEFHYNPDGSIDLTHEQQIQAGHFEADKSIGSHSPIQSPAWTATDSGKLIGQYRKMYVFKQAERIANMFKDAKAGNVAPLIRYLAIGVPVSGAAITIAKDEIKDPGSNPFSDPKQFVASSVLHSGLGAVGYGAVDSALNAATHNYGNDSRWSNVANAVSPGAGFAVQTGQNVAKAFHHNVKPLEREAIKTFLPVGGTAVANRFAPTTKPSASGKFLKPGEGEVALTDGSGNPITNAQGKPDTIVIPKGVTGAAKDALVQDATNNAIAKNIKASLSPNEKVLYNQPDARLKSMLDQKKIDQGTYNQIMAYKQVASNVTRAPAVLPPALDANVRDYINQTSKLTDQGKDNWLKNAKGQALSQKVADALNSQLPTGISPLPASKDLLEAYAKFDQARAKAANDPDPNKQWDEIVTRGKLRDFWKNAIEVSQPKDVKEVYGLSMTQLKDYFLANKKVSMDQLKAAVALNDTLLASDLSDSDKYSKKFRAAFGLPDAPEIGSGTGSGGSSGGSGSGTKQYVSIGGKKYAVTAEGTPVEVTGSDGLTKVVRVNAQGLSNSPIGLSSLVPSNLSFKAPAIDTTPKKLSFKVNLPENVRGNPRPQRVVSNRYTTVRIK